MPFFSKLFGGGAKPETSAEPSELYKEFRIFAVPEAGNSGYRVSARIEKDVDGDVKVHHLNRADTLRSLDDAVDLSLRKARQVIDEQGVRIFR